MAHVDELKDSTHSDLKDLAAKHDSFDAFWRDLQSLAEKLWHNSKSQNEVDQSVQPTPAPASQTGAGNEPAEGAQVEAGPVDEGTETKSADPASPVSDGGFPTSNVGVVVSPNEDDGTAVPVKDSPAI